MSRADMQSVRAWRSSACNPSHMRAASIRKSRSASAARNDALASHDSSNDTRALCSLRHCSKCDSKSAARLADTSAASSSAVSRSTRCSRATSADFCTSRCASRASSLILRSLEMGGNGGGGQGIAHPAAPLSSNGIGPCGIGGHNAGSAVCPDACMWDAMEPGIEGSGDATAPQARKVSLGVKQFSLCVGGGVMRSLAMAPWDARFSIGCGVRSCAARPGASILSCHVGGGVLRSCAMAPWVTSFPAGVIGGVLWSCAAAP
mmetsp:Transcript_66846/g.186633  ORF Transcript_66846/g.186633 Transcript_66846/m.186633 type:complete len:262 (-) Transcript_66846:713-1498(-)